MLASMGAKSKEKTTKFVCPKDGNIGRDDVAFLCNTCGKNDLKERDGIFLCPGCLKEGENFQCMLCDSREVKVVIAGEKSSHL